MEANEFMKLYEERKLLKQLVHIDPVRYGYLQARIAFIKVYINSAY